METDWSNLCSNIFVELIIYHIDPYILVEARRAIKAVFATLNEKRTIYGLCVKHKILTQDVDTFSRFMVNYIMKYDPKNSLVSFPYIVETSILNDDVEAYENCKKYIYFGCIYTECFAYYRKIKLLSHFSDYHRSIQSWINDPNALTRIIKDCDETIGGKIITIEYYTSMVKHEIMAAKGFLSNGSYFKGDLENEIKACMKNDRLYDLSLCGIQYAVSTGRITSEDILPTNRYYSAVCIAEFDMMLIGEKYGDEMIKKFYQCLKLDSDHVYCNAFQYDRLDLLHSKIFIFSNKSNCIRWVTLNSYKIVKFLHESCDKTKQDIMDVMYGKELGLWDPSSLCPRYYVNTFKYLVDGISEYDCYRVLKYAFITNDAEMINLILSHYNAKIRITYIKAEDIESDYEDDESKEIVVLNPIASVRHVLKLHGITYKD